MEECEFTELTVDDLCRSINRRDLGVLGLPGTGKLNLVRKLMSQTTSTAICKMHAAASGRNSKTMDCFAKRYIRNGSVEGTLLLMRSVR